MDDFLFLDKSTQLVKRALRETLAPGAAGYLDMFHDDAVFEFPYAPGGAICKEGKAQMATYLRSIASSNALEALVLTAAYPITKPQTIGYGLADSLAGHQRAAEREQGRVAARQFGRPRRAALPRTAAHPRPSECAGTGAPLPDFHAQSNRSIFGGHAVQGWR